MLEALQTSKKSLIALGMLLVAAGLAGALATPLGAQAENNAPGGIIETEIRCNESAQRCRQIIARFELPGGASGILALSFQEAIGLTRESLGIEVEPIDPRDPQIRARLPRNVFIPDGFPVLIRIEARSGQSVLSFERDWDLEIFTRDLEWSPQTPLGLFRAPTGGSFENISTSVGSGSFRVRGAGGNFSEFVIAADMRPREVVIGRQREQLETIINANLDLLGQSADELLLTLAEIAHALEEDNLRRAVVATDFFLFLVRNLVDTRQIPVDSVPSRGDVSLAASLLSTATSLRHGLLLQLQADRSGTGGFNVEVAVDDERSLEVLLSFEDTFAIDLDRIDISSEIVDPTDPELLARLPSGVTIPEEFPVILSVRPAASVAQAFSGLLEVELRTDALDFLADTPLRLFKAPDGGAFADVTQTFGLGSFRVRGAGGNFSEFLIAEDRRPAEAVVAGKIDRAEKMIEDPDFGLPSAVREELLAGLGQVRQLLASGQLDQALRVIRNFSASVRDMSGDEIPAAWRSGGEALNVAGELRSLAGSIAFSVELQKAPAVDPADVNRDGRVDVGDVFQVIDRVFGAAPSGLLRPASEDER